jgi:hypothetical protein
VNRALLLLAVAGCHSFEDPDIVVDLRMLAISASIPEQVVTVDLANPQTPTELLQQLVPVEFCALIADPAFDRQVRYAFTLCTYGGGERCDDKVLVPLGSGIIDDPDTTVPEPRICTTVDPNGNLLGVLLDALKDDTLHGLGGIDALVELELGGVDSDPALDLFAAKDLRVNPRIPAERTPNANPSLARIEATIEGELPTTLSDGRCIDAAPAMTVAPGTKVRFTPIEADGAREVYVVPTLDGRSRMFTENLSYQWSASAGSFSDGNTGGPRGVTGSTPPLFTDWRAPPADQLAGPTDVSLWIVQRDERLGVHWYESCIRVAP